MSERLKCLDLFCGAGGAAMGLYRAGFDVVGVDIHKQPRYPFEFVQADALTFPLDGFDFVWASPPCQAHTALRNITKRSYDDFIPRVRTLLFVGSAPFVIENVVGAPLADPVMLCGMQFGLKVYRHRLFESSIPLGVPVHVPHNDNCRIRKGISRNGFISVAGDGGFGCGKGGVQYARNAMGVTWTSRAELSQAIPPAYSEYLGKQVVDHILASRLQSQA